MRSAGSGDRLARGAVSATYLANEGNKITQDLWDKAFNDFDPEKFKKRKPRRKKEAPETTPEAPAE